MKTQVSFNASRPACSAPIQVVLCVLCEDLWFSSATFD